MTVRPSWQPDPTQRHQYRWWDGSAWTDTVADDGRPATDPLHATPMLISSGRSTLPRAVPAASPAPELPAPGAPAAEAAPVVRVTVIPTFDPSGAKFAAQPPPKRRRPPIGRWLATGFVMCMFAAVFIGVGVKLWQNRQNDEPEPAAVVSTGTIEEEGAAIGRTFELSAGQAVRLRVEIPDDLLVGAYVQIPAEEGPGELVADLCCDDGRGYLTGAVATADDVTYQLVVVSRKGTGDVRMIIEPLEGASLESGDGASDLLDDPFFSDSGFFSDDDAYAPAVTDRRG